MENKTATQFSGNVLFVGYGAVAQCALPILFQKTGFKPSQITVMDFENRRGLLAPFLEKGVQFVQEKIAAENMGAVLSRYLKAGDLLIDLAWNIDCCEILQWCHDRGVMYLNTSVEVWDPYAGAENAPPTQRTLYWRHMAVRAMKSRWREAGPTAVLEHGANPGLISHWTKHGLLAIADRGLAEGKYIDAQAERIRQAAQDRNFPVLSRELGVKVIHCSERDTQVTSTPKQVGEFVNTWSIEGFREEGLTTAELGWGTHEKELPQDAQLHQDGPRNQICLARMGINTQVRSWVPGHEIYGMVVRHGEAFTISDKLTVWEEGEPVYRPTVHYAYCPSDSAIASLNELRGDGYRLQSKLRILNDEITSGADILGALIMGHAYQSWWVGSRLSIEESRKHVPHQNATTMQVAASVIGAVLWMLENPDRGVCVPDDLPHDFILEHANPYLGDFLSMASDWTPLKNLQNYFPGYRKLDIDTTDPWQFKNFLVQD